MTEARAVSLVSSRCHCSSMPPQDDNMRQAQAGATNPCRQFYSPILAKVRRVIVGRMAKPEEGQIVEDENAVIVREMTKDSDAIALY